MNYKPWKDNNLLHSTPNYEESKKICKSAKSFINYIRKHKDIYYESGEFDKVEYALNYITETIYGNKYLGIDFEEMIQQYIDEILSLGEEEYVEIYRGLKLKEESDVNWDHLGTSWTYDYDSALEFLKYFTDKYEGKEFVIQAETHRDNIDWILSICLNLTHINEKELRVIDDTKIEDPYIEEVDEQ